MTLTLIAPPASLPVTTADLSEHLRLPHGAPEIEQTQELARLIEAATTLLERRLDTALIYQTWLWRIGHWREATRFPLAPIHAIQSIEIIDADGLIAPWPGWRLDPLGFGLTPATGHSWPSIPVGGHAAIRMIAGYAEAAGGIPADLRHAVTLLAAHFFENREAAADRLAAIPLGVASLIAPYRPIRL